MAPAATAVPSPEDLAALLALEPPVVRPDRVQAASRRVEDGDLPDAQDVAAAIVSEHAGLDLDR
jgi:hypothetical protein